MSAGSTLVSIVLPTHNRDAVIDRAIQSVLRQTYQEFELIVVDDASTDETEELVDSYRDGRVTYVRHDVNRGAPAARNTGFQNASGELVAYIDSDDEWLPSKLEKQVAEFERWGPDVGLVYTGFYMVHGHVTEVGKKPTKSGDIFRDMLAFDQVGPTSTVMVRSECLRTCGGFDESLPARQDYDLWLRLTKSYDVAYVQEPLVKIHREHEGKISDNVESRISAHQKVLEKLEPELARLPRNERNEVLGQQYFSMARFLQRNERFRLAREKIRMAVSYYPYSAKAWLVLLMIYLGLTDNSRVALRIKNLARSLRWEAPDD